MPRELREGSRGRCRNCGGPIQVLSISTGRFHPPFWRLEWRHVYTGYSPTGLQKDRGRHCFNAPVAQPAPHRKRVPERE